MTTTPPPDERPASETPDVADGPAPAGPPPADWRPVPPPGYAPAPYPFAPVAREPWINPRRRGTATGLAAGGLVVALALGFGIGYGVAPSHAGHDGPGGQRIGRGYFPGEGPALRLPNRLGPRHGQLPGSGRVPGNGPNAGNGTGNGSGSAPQPNQPGAGSSSATPSGSPTH